MIERLRKGLFDGRFPLLRKLLSWKLFGRMASCLSPTRKVMRAIGRFKKLRDKYGFSDVYFSGERIFFETKDGLLFYVNQHTKPLLMYQENERGSVEILASRLKKNGVFIDVGANLGWFTVFMAKKKGVVVHAFEPVSKTRALLVDHLKLNALDKVIVSPYALGDKSGQAFITTDHFGTNHLAKKATNTEKIAIKTFDDYFRDAGLKTVDCIKIDIEGAELLMLKGAREVLKRFKPVLLVEIDARYTSRYGYVPDELYGFLRSLGYTCLYVFKGKQRYDFVSMKDALQKGDNFFFA